MRSEPGLAAAAALVAQPARAELVLAVLADGPLTASELAARAGIARSTASGHLGRLVAGGFLAVSGRGRNRYYELSGADVAEAVEALSRVAPQRAALAPGGDAQRAPAGGAHLLRPSRGPARSRVRRRARAARRRPARRRRLRARRAGGG